MDVRFEDGSLARLETDARFTANHSRAIVRSYRRVITYVRAAGDEHLRAWPGLRFKRLEGVIAPISTRCASTISFA